MYTVATLVIHKKGYPDVLQCYLEPSCTIPQTTTSYKYIIGILITKAVLLPLSVIIELIVAVYIVDGYKCKKMPARVRCVLFMRAFVVWQLLVFVQITLGLVSIPLFVLFFISPTQLLLISVAALLMFIMTTFVLTIIPYPNTSKIWKLFPSCRVFIESILIVALIVLAFITYYVTVTDGMNLDGVKGYILTLIPTVPISVFIWIIKKKYLAGKVKKTKSGRKLDSLLLSRREHAVTMEDEDNNPSSAEVSVV